MGKTSNQENITQRNLNEYERSKMMRVQENKEKLRELGVKTIVNSCKSLVESHKTKKSKKKVVTNEKDLEYMPDFSIVDSEDDYVEELSTGVGVKHNRLHYIAPLSMNKYANLAKQQRVMAPNISRVFSLKEGSVPDRNSVDSHVLKKSLLQQSQEGRKKNPGRLDTSSAKQKQHRETITMGDLILSKKDSLRQREVSKQNVLPSHSTMKNISSGPRRKLFCVNNDSVGDDDVSSQDLNEEQDIADIEPMMFDNNQNRSVEDDLGCQVNEADKEKRGVEDDEDEYTDDMMYENIPNGTEEDDSDDDLENENDEPVREQQEAPQSETTGATCNSKKRGHGVHVRGVEAREVIICNEFGQPIGPVTEEKDIVGQFSRFLGTIARMNNYAPLIYDSWHKVPDKEKIWEYVLAKYIVPDNAESWVLMSIGAAWRGYKCRIKKKHFYEHKDNKTRWKNRPKSILDKDFSKLLSYWSKKEVMNLCSLKKNVRVSQKNMHTAGLQSFARIREELKNEDPNKEPPTLTKLFERTRQRTEGNIYVDTYDDTAKKIEQMKNYKPESVH